MPSSSQSISRCCSRWRAPRLPLRPRFWRAEPFEWEVRRTRRPPGAGRGRRCRHGRLPRDWRFGGGPSIPALHGARPWTSLALAAAVSISLVIGHAVAVTVGLAGPRFSGAARETVDRPSPHRVRPPRRRVCGRRGPSRGDRAPRGHVRTHAGIRCNPNRSARHRDRHRRLDPALVGLSDLLPDPTKPTAIASVPSAADSDPARVWTTIATGMPPASHGITALEQARCGIRRCRRA